jgi:hypothetical protein
MLISVFQTPGSNVHVRACFCLTTALDRSATQRSINEERKPTENPPLYKPRAIIQLVELPSDNTTARH